MHVRILGRSIISVQSHHLSDADVIALVNSYVIEMRIYHDHSIRPLELDVTRRRLSCISWSVSYTLDSAKFDPSFKRPFVLNPKGYLGGCSGR